MANNLVRTKISMFMVIYLLTVGWNRSVTAYVDKDGCAEQLLGLATCLPYIGGQAKAPTPDCCGGLKQVLNSNKKCLCVAIRDRDDPDLGLQINATLALGLPSVCHAPADITKCPALLHMDPNSPEAQVFYQIGKGSNHSATSPAPTPTPTSVGNELNNSATNPAPTPTPTPTSVAQGNQTSIIKGGSTQGPSKSKGCCIKRRWLGLEMIVVYASFCYLFSLHF